MLTETLNGIISHLLNGLSMKKDYPFESMTFEKFLTFLEYESADKKFGDFMHAFTESEQLLMCKLFDLTWNKIDAEKYDEEEYDECERKLLNMKLAELFWGINVEIKTVKIDIVSGFNDDPRSHRIEDEDGYTFASLKKEVMTEREEKIYNDHKGQISYPYEGMPTLRDFLNMLMYIKGSKVDRCYEMFSIAEFRLDLHTNELTVNVEFDHGS